MEITPAGYMCLAGVKSWKWSFLGRLFILPG